MKKTTKMITCIVLMFTILVSSFAIKPIEKANALVGIDDVSLALIIAAFAGAGVKLINDVDGWQAIGEATKAVGGFVNNSIQGVSEWVINNFTDIGDGLHLISDDAYKALQDYTYNTYGSYAGQNGVPIPSYSQFSQEDYDRFLAFVQPGSYMLGSSFGYNNVFLEVFFDSSNGMMPMAKTVYIDGSYQNYSHTVETSFYANPQKITMYLYENYIWFYWSYISASTGELVQKRRSWESAPSGIVESLKVNVDSSANIKNPPFADSTNDGKRAIYIPPSITNTQELLEWIAETDPSAIQRVVGDVVIPQPTTEPIYIPPITVPDAWSGAKDFFDGIGKTLTNTWDAVKSIPKVITDATTSAVEGVRDAVKDLFKVPDATGIIDGFTLPKIITEKFPFCIPFDLYNSFAQLDAPPQAPVFELPWTVRGTTAVWRLDMSFFDPLAVVVRWGVLLMFNWFLIINTRKLIGGGGS